MPRRVYLVSYDVADDHRRTAIFKTLRDAGDHVQYSVFFCELNDRELVQLKGRLDQYLNHDQDQIIILDLGEGLISLERALTCLGQPYTPPTRCVVV